MSDLYDESTPHGSVESRIVEMDGLFCEADLVDPRGVSDAKGVSCVQGSGDADASGIESAEVLLEMEACPGDDPGAICAILGDGDICFCGI